jgi:hypothetical protein
VIIMGQEQGEILTNRDEDPNLNLVVYLKLRDWISIHLLEKQCTRKKRDSL